MKIPIKSLLILLSTTCISHASSEIAPKMSAGFNNNESIPVDNSKSTCAVTMPMIESINCANFPPPLFNFCLKNKPFLMTRQECLAAESSSQNSKMGPNKEQCQNLSFSAGSGSWSYVLACSYAGDFVSDQDGKQNPNNQIDDPECIQKLTSKGVEFKSLGQFNNGVALGQQCVVKNAVQISKIAGVDLIGRRTMTCEYALALHSFASDMSSIGVVKFPLATIDSCRPIRDKNGNGKSLSGHGKGIAGDMAHFYLGAVRYDMGDLIKPGSPGYALTRQAKQFACKHFGLVLSAEYEKYRGAYTHFHMEIRGGKSTCK